MQYKRIWAILLMALATQVLFSQKARPSPNASVAQTFGLTEVSVKYCRPGVKGRSVWESKVAPYDKVWRTGANEATTITFSKDVKIDGKTVKGGSYTLFSIPTKGNEWTVIINKTTGQWGTQYDQSTDLMRFKAKAKAIDHKERFEIQLDNPTNDSVDFVMSWAKVQVSFPISNI